LPATRLLRVLRCMVVDHADTARLRISFARRQVFFTHLTPTNHLFAYAHGCWMRFVLVLRSTRLPPRHLRLRAAPRTLFSHLCALTVHRLYAPPCLLVAPVYAMPFNARHLYATLVCTFVHTRTRFAYHGWFYARLLDTPLDVRGAARHRRCERYTTCFICTGCVSVSPRVSFAWFRERLDFAPPDLCVCMFCSCLYRDTTPFSLPHWRYARSDRVHTAFWTFTPSLHILPSSVLITCFSFRYYLPAVAVPSLPVTCNLFCCLGLVTLDWRFSSFAHGYSRSQDYLPTHGFGASQCTLEHSARFTRLPLTCILPALRFAAMTLCNVFTPRTTGRTTWFFVRQHAPPYALPAAFAHSNAARSSARCVWPSFTFCRFTYVSRFVLNPSGRLYRWFTTYYVVPFRGTRHTALPHIAVRYVSLRVVRFGLPVVHVLLLRVSLICGFAVYANCTAPLRATLFGRSRTLNVHRLLYAPYCLFSPFAYLRCLFARLPVGPTPSLPSAVAAPTLFLRVPSFMAGLLRAFLVLQCDTATARHTRRCWNHAHTPHALPTYTAVWRTSFAVTVTVSLCVRVLLLDTTPGHQTLRTRVTPLRFCVLLLGFRIQRCLTARTPLRAAFLTRTHALPFLAVARFVHMNYVTPTLYLNAGFSSPRLLLRCGMGAALPILVSYHFHLVPAIVCWVYRDAFVPLPRTPLHVSAFVACWTLRFHAPLFVLGNVTYVLPRCLRGGFTMPLTHAFLRGGFFAPPPAVPP